MNASRSQPGFDECSLASADAQPSAVLAPTLSEALAEVGRYDGQNRCYWWRVASMRKLEARGFVETYRPPSLDGYRGKQLPYRITDAGRAALKAESRS